jgi:hypothetical protein
MPLEREQNYDSFVTGTAKYHVRGIQAAPDGQPIPLSQRGRNVSLYR